MKRVIVIGAGMGAYLLQSVCRMPDMRWRFTKKNQSRAAKCIKYVNKDILLM